MKPHLIIATSAVALAIAGTASAQTLPLPRTVAPPVQTPRVTPPLPDVVSPTARTATGAQVEGRVAGAVQAPRPGGVTGAASNVVGDARNTARGVANDARGAVDDVRGSTSANANANVNASLRINRDRAAVNAAIEGGVQVRSSDGALLGTIAEISRNATGRVTSFVVRSADGAMRVVPTGNVGLQGDVLVTGWTESQFTARRARGGADRR